LAGIIRGMPVLVVDDELALRQVLSEVLGDDGHQVSVASTAEEALDIFRNEHFPLVITDIRMPGMSGIELLQEIKRIDSDTQVIIITSHASLDTALTALRHGAYDYLLKPFEDIDLVSAVTDRALEKIRLIMENRKLIEELQKTNLEMERSNKALKELAIRDGLTGLFNHRYFQEALALELIRSRRHKHLFSLILLDVDRFKEYNDAHGHLEGDKLLCMLGELIRKDLRRSDVMARYGGEEFVIILPETDKDAARGIAEGIRHTVAEYPFHGREKQPTGNVTVSLGVATFPHDGRDGSTLLGYADRALYDAKKRGRNLVC
jgi:diguanylate cyclase (GGDEF)-like protein